MRTVLPGRPAPKLQAVSTALWEGIRVIAYISGNAVIILGGPQKVLQTIYLDDVEWLSAVNIDGASGRIAVCGGRTILVYNPSKIRNNVEWKLHHTIQREDADSSDEDDNDGDGEVRTLSWGGSGELLAGSKSLVLWHIDDDAPHAIWTNKLANRAKIAQFSYDAGLIASTGDYDRFVKVWRRLSFGADEARFDVTYLRHPSTVTGIHWRRPHHVEQTIDNVLYTICSDNKIRIWAPMDRHALQALQLWNVIDMEASIQPRYPPKSPNASNRYGFIVDSRDFSLATERAVQLGPATEKDKFALDHLIEAATKSPEVCVILDENGHMCVWGLENAGCKAHAEANIFNIAHVEGLDLSTALGNHQTGNYAQFYSFAGGVSDASFTVITHYYDGRIEWFDSRVDILFDPTPRKHRLVSQATWSGHTESVKKIVRTPSGKVLSSRTNDNNAVIWRQRSNTSTGSVLVQQSALNCDMHIHRTCLLEDGNFLVNLHHNGISMWDIRSFEAQMIAKSDLHLSSKPLCVLLIPTSEFCTSYIAAIGADMTGVAWEVTLPAGNTPRGQSKKHDTPVLREFSTFSLGSDEEVAYILPVDPAGSKLQASHSLDLFATDIALSYSHNGTIKTWTAKVDKSKGRVDWLLTATVETGIPNPSLASAGSVRKAALVDQNRTRLTIWDTNSAQLELEERFEEHDIIQDLDWTSTPDIQSILAVGFPHKVILLSQLRYDYLDAGPSWAQIREIKVGRHTPHPIGDSCWLGNGNLVVGTGNQLFVYDKYIEASNRWVTNLRLPYHDDTHFDLFDAVSRLNGPLPVFHPQFLAQCILSGKISLVHLILTKLHRKLKFVTDGDEVDGFLDIPLEDIYNEVSPIQQITYKEMNSTYANFTLDHEPRVLDESIATSLNEYLKKITLPQLSSKEQFRLVDIVECVTTVEKHRRSMDVNAARYILFFRQYMLRKSQGFLEEYMVPWREIVWAFHSDSHEILTDLVGRQFHGKMLWENARESGIFMWITDINALRSLLEVIARNEYTKSDDKNPIDCSIFYLALKKKKVLQGLWRMATWHREQPNTHRFLSNNFQEERWQTAALKNAFALLGKRRFEYAAAFFLLADHLRDAVNVCINQLRDIQLAITIARAYEGDDGPVLKEILEERVLITAATEGNRWMATWAFWMLNRRDMAVRALVTPIEGLLPPTPGSPASPGQVALQAKSYLSNDPALVVLYQQLREKTLQTLKGASRIGPREEWEFVLRNARLYDRMGCDLLALNLVREWEFLTPSHPTDTVSDRLSISFMEDSRDPRKILERRGSLVVADMHITHDKKDDARKAEANKDGSQPAKNPTQFQEPESSSLLDSFGF
ncbi:WD repeat protein [Trichophyton violaceum]|uniref:WD repeat protein n=1 Tax=Trichophyton violaceum TaxID=34388 RepID=A0A178FTP1_TRIVO|nr:WD repeat protein [Trichophyton violaceum]